MKTCKHPTCENVCRRPKRERKVYRIKKVSDKRSKLDKIYSSMRVLFLKHHPVCKVCGGRAEQIHHKAGRLGGFYLDTTTWLSVCSPCHRWIELNPVEAKERGYSVSRLKK